MMSGRLDLREARCLGQHLRFSEGATDAHDSLRKVLGYVHASIVEAACVPIPVTREQVGVDGLITDPSIRAKAVEVLTSITAFVAKHATAGE